MVALKFKTFRIQTLWLQIVYLKTFLFINLNLQFQKCSNASNVQSDSERYPCLQEFTFLIDKEKRMEILILLTYSMRILP